MKIEQLKIGQLWTTWLEAMHDVFGFPPGYINNIADWLITQVRDLKKERDELRAQLAAITIERDELRANPAFYIANNYWRATQENAALREELRKPRSESKKRSLHEKARDVADMIYCGSTPRSIELTAKIEALFQD